jgi:hypothetical protein
MAERQAAGAPTTPGGTDWAALLRAFAGHPDQVPGPTPWWQPALTSTAAADQIAPTVPTVAGDALATRAAEPHRRALEQRYEALSAGAEAAYRHKVNSAFVLDSTLTAGMLGGLSGLISGLVYGAEAGPAGKAVGAGALGLVSGAAAAMLGSLLITGVATAIDDHAGSTTGAIVSWAGSPVGAWFLGEVIADHL